MALFGRCRALSRPSIERNMVMIAAGGEKHGRVAVASRDLKAEEVAVKNERPIEVGDREMNMPNGDFRMYCHEASIRYFPGFFNRQ
jgi:hypothetical protein